MGGRAGEARNRVCTCTKRKGFVESYVENLYNPAGAFGARIAARAARAVRAPHEFYNILRIPRGWWGWNRVNRTVLMLSATNFKTEMVAFNGSHRALEPNLRREKAQRNSKLALK